MRHSLVHNALVTALLLAGSTSFAAAQNGDTTQWGGTTGASLHVKAYKTVEDEAVAASAQAAAEIEPITPPPAAEEPAMEAPAEEAPADDVALVIEPIMPPPPPEPEPEPAPADEAAAEEEAPSAPEPEPVTEPTPAPQPKIEPEEEAEAAPAPEAAAIDAEVDAEVEAAAEAEAEVIAPVAEPAPAPIEEPVAEEAAPAEPAPAPIEEPVAEEAAPVEPVTEPAPAPVTEAPAKKLTGRDIALKMDSAQHVKDATRVATMLIERRGQQLTRKMLMRAKRYGVDERSVIRFDEPADVRDTQYLSWVYDNPQKDDDLWVYFPSENMIRRISGGGKKGAFMRSDFANEDIEARAVDDDTHVLLEETEFDGKPVYVIESTPISIKAKDSSYSKRKIWVDKAIWLPLRVEFYDKRGKLLKTLLHGGIEEIDGVWTATKLIMETPRRKSRTLMQYHDVTYNSGLGDDLFNQSSLKR